MSCKMNGRKYVSRMYAKWGLKSKKRYAAVAVSKTNRTPPQDYSDPLHVVI